MNTKVNLTEDLRRRGMIHDIMPGTEELLLKQPVTGYIGFDPTADSLHVGNLVQVMLLVHFQQAGHKPIAIVGGATGKVGDPAGKAEERKILSDADIEHNTHCITKQLKKFLRFGEIPNRAEVFNNNVFYKEVDLFSFLRDVGKHITVNYMMSKESIKSRVESGLSSTEFFYLLLQAYDFYWLFKHKGCKLQMGGSDQWGNMTAGTELIRRKTGEEAFAFTCPLLTKSDGSKFGKTESGNIWLDAERTSPYAFYQFWINASDADAARYMKIFSTQSIDEISAIIKKHEDEPHLRLLQKELAREVTVRVHSEPEYEAAVEASQVLFGENTTNKLKSMPEKLLLDVFEGVPISEVTTAEIQMGIKVIDLLVNTKILPSKSEAKRMIKNGGISINKEKILSEEKITSSSDLLNGKYILIQKGKKQFHLVVVR